MAKKPLISTSVKLVAGAVLAVVVFGFGYVALGSATYSDGERSGVVTKFSRKGMLLKTWEGELNMGGFDTGGVATTWEFSVDDPEIVEELQQAQRAGGRWTLAYRQQLWAQSWKGGTSYFITDVQPAGKINSQQ